MKFYIAKASCGCIVGGHTDHDKSDRKLIAKWMSDWIKDGLTVEHVEAETVTLSNWPCEHEHQPEVK